MCSLDELIERRKSHVEYLDKLKSWNNSLALEPHSEHSLKSQSSTMTSDSRSAPSPGELARAGKGREHARPLAFAPIPGLC